MKTIHLITTCFDDADNLIISELKDLIQKNQDAGHLIDVITFEVFKNVKEEIKK